MEITSTRMDIKLYINEVLVDLPKDIARQLRVSKGGTDVSNIDSRTADQSYSLTLPPTRTNEALFRNKANHQVMGKFYAATPYRARLEVNGRLILSGGWKLNGIRGGYTGLIYAAEVDVFTLIGKKTLRELTFDPFEYKGKHNFAELLEETGDVCWPLVAYGNFFSPPGEEGKDVPPSSRIVAGLEVDDYTPSVFYTSILHQIFKDIGWQATGEPLDDPFFSELCLPHVGEEYRWNWGELLKLNASCTAMVANSSNEFRFLRTLGVDTLFWVLELEEVYNPARRFRPDADLEDRNSYGVRKEGGYDLSAQVTVTSSFNGGTGWLNGVWLRIVKLLPGQSLQQGEVVAEKKIPGDNVTITNGTYTATANSVYFQEADRIVAVIQTDEYGVFTGKKFINLSDLSLSITPVVDEIGPLAIDIAANLPEINQLDFVKSFLTLGNLRFVTDVIRKTITFYFKYRYELPADFAVDLTAYGDPEECECLPATKARRFLFQYADDTEDALLQERKGFADMVYDTGNSNAEGDQPLTLPFAPVVFRNYWESASAYKLGKLINLPCLASQDQLSAPLNTVSWDYGYVPRLLRYTGLSTATVPLAFTGGAHVYGKASFEGLTWPELYQRFYADHITEITKGHLLKGSFPISADFYRRLSPARPVLFHGGLYRLNKVQGFQVAALDGRAEIELLYIVKSDNGGGAPWRSTEGGKEFYHQEFYPGEFY